MQQAKQLLITLVTAALLGFIGTVIQNAFSKTTNPIQAELADKE